MAKQRNSKGLPQGFTLLELSIVLVIIGLLVGTIVGMRSYVRNAQLNTMMNETKIYTSAFAQFQTRYNAPPGDYNNATNTWSGTANGDGNGVIRAPGVSSTAIKEPYLAFQHLALAGYIQGKYTGAANASSGATVGVNIAGSTMENVGYAFDHPDIADGNVSGDATYPDGIYGNVLRAAGVKGVYLALPNLPFLTGLQAYQLDTKFDDGVPNTGNIIAPKYSSVVPINTCATSTAPYTYDTSTGAVTCYFFIKLQ